MQGPYLQRLPKRNLKPPNRLTFCPTKPTKLMGIEPNLRRPRQGTRAAAGVAEEAVAAEAVPVVESRQRPVNLPA